MSSNLGETSVPAALGPLERTFPWDPRCSHRGRLFWPLRAAAAPFENFADWPEVTVVDAALSDRAGIHFHEQPPRVRRRRRGRRLPIEAETLYDARISLSGWVPTRPRNWHDFLNALVWATFPVAKRAFHARQHAAVAARIESGARVLPGVRSREMDALAILDEGGLLLLVDEARAGQMAEWIDRGELGRVRDVIAAGAAIALLFGHALYETLLAGHGKSIWAMVTLLPCPGPLPVENAARIELADERLAVRIAEPGSFRDPATFRNLPLDEQILCP